MARGLGGWPVDPVTGKAVYEVRLPGGETLSWDGVFCARCGQEPCQCFDGDGRREVDDLDDEDGW